MKQSYVTPILIVLIFVGFIGFVFYAKSQPSPLMKLSSREIVNECTSDAETVFHLHSELTVMANKKLVEIPAEIGVDRINNCMSAIHTHDPNGIIHVESPIKKDFILGDFFFKWGKTLNSQQILDFQVDDQHALKVYVDGRESQEFENIVLKDKQKIFIDYYNLKDGPDPVPGVDPNAPLA